MKQNISHFNKHKRLQVTEKQKTIFKWKYKPNSVLYAQIPLKQSDSESLKITIAKGIHRYNTKKKRYCHITMR